jgi:hypothetical protein
MSVARSMFLMTTFFACLVPSIAAELASGVINTAPPPELEGVGRPRFVVELIDGSRLIGAASEEPVRFKSSAANLLIPWRHIRALLLQEKSLKGTVLLRNGENLVGDIDLTSLTITNGLGVARLSRSLLKQVKPTFQEEPAKAPRL